MTRNGSVTEALRAGVLALIFVIAGGQGLGAAPICDGTLQANGKDVVALFGTLLREVHWGRPNYGENPETDSRFRAWILVVDKPVSAVVVDDTYNPPPDVQTLTRIHVLFGEIHIDRAEFTDRHVGVEGTLNEAIGPAVVTPIYLSLSKIERTYETGCGKGPQI